MNKKILLTLGIIIGVTFAIIPLSFLGFPFPSGNPDGFEKATFEDSRVGEPEANVLPGIDLGPYGDLLLGPLGIIVVFTIVLGLFYLVKKIPDSVKQPKFIIFAILATILISLLVIPLGIVSTNIRWNNSIEVNSDQIWTFTMEHASLEGMKYGVENVNGTITMTIEFKYARINHIFKISSESLEIAYSASTTYYTSEGPTYKIQISDGESSITAELTPTEEITYTLEVTGSQMVSTVEMVSAKMKYSLEQSNDGIIYTIGIEL